MTKDIRYAFRSLVKRPGATAIALVTLALGIGVNTAIFSAVDSVLLRPLPFKDPQRLVSVWEQGLRIGINQNEVAPANFFDLRNQNQTFEGIGAFGPQDVNLTGAGDPERLNGQLVTANVLSILGVDAAAGRTFLANEDQSGQHRVVVLSDAFWQRRFNRDPSILNRNLTLNGEPYTVVGIMPRGFFFPSREVELWIPWAMGPEQASGRGDHYLRLVARVKTDASIERANAELESIAGRLAAEYPRTNEGLNFFARSLHQDYVGDLRLPILIMFAAVGLVLLIACANVANVLVFTLGMSALTAIVFGGVPALLASRTKPGETLSDVARDAAGGSSGRLVRRVLVVSEVALAVVLLVGAGLLIRSFQLVRQVDTGFTTEDRLTMKVVLPMPKYAKPEARRAFYDEMLRRVKEVPGVESAGLITFLPLVVNGMNFTFSVEGKATPGDMKLPFAVYRTVSPDYFDAMGIPLQRGRFFNALDSPDSQPVVVVNRRLAERFWPNEEALGQRLKIGPADSPSKWLTVAGVVGDARQTSIYDEKMEFYVPYMHLSFFFCHCQAMTDGKWRMTTVSGAREN